MLSILQLNDCTNAYSIDLSSVRASVNKWIVSEYNIAIAKTTAAIESYRFNEAADALYHLSGIVIVIGMSK